MKKLMIFAHFEICSLQIPLEVFIAGTQVMSISSWPIVVAKEDVNTVGDYVEYCVEINKKYVAC